MAAIRIAAPVLVLLAAACAADGGSEVRDAGGTPVPASVPAPAPAAIVYPPPPPAPPEREPEPVEGGFWTLDELRLVDEGLTILNCNRRDLAFQKQPIDDPFRLQVVRRALDDPLSVGNEAEAWDREARSGDPLRLLVRAGGQMAGGDPVTTATPFPAPAIPLSRVGPGVRDAVGRMTLATELVKGSLDGGLREIDPGTGKVVAARRPVLPGGADRAPFLRKAMGSQVEKPALVIDAPELEDARFLEFLKEHSEGLADLGVDSQFALILAQELIDALRAEGGFEKEWRGGERIRTDAGIVVLYGTGDDGHALDEDASLVIDLGGNDTWLGGASASILKDRPVSVCIDLSGDDRYVGRGDLSFGAALGGVAIQWDGGGNDLYDAGNASLGAGIAGVGILVDEGGDDVYRCGDFGIGAGAFGIGILLDRGGNDLYHGDLFNEGFASTRGCGVLADLDGNDVYDAGGAHLHAPLYNDRHQSLSQGFSIGMRPDASGGVGVLVDVKGNDRYTADIYGQGASYWYSLGILVDDDGNDTYNLGQYGQGSGIHLSAGILLDRAGSDLYYLKNGVGMGGAHDYAVGMLVDRGGDDYYAGSGGTQGGALTNSVAFLIDMGGNDGYAAVNDGVQGYASPARGTGGIGILADAGGKDVYTERTRDGAAWTSSIVGAGIDRPDAEVAAGGSGDPGTTSMTEEKARAEVDRDGTVAGADGKTVDDLEKLWAVSCRWEVGDNRVIVPIARERLVALGKPALARALERVGTKDGLEYRAVEVVFSKFPREEVVPPLLEKTRDAEGIVRRGAVRALAGLQAAEAEGRFAEMLGEDPSSRATVLGALAALKKAPPAVAGFLRSEKESEGVAAAGCLGAAGGEEAVRALMGALGADVPLPVRLAAVERLGALGEAAVPALVAFVGTEFPSSAWERRNALRALGKSKSPAAVEGIARALGDSNRWVRLAAFQAGDELAKELGAEAPSSLAAAMAAARAAETDPLLRRLR